MAKSKKKKQRPTPSQQRYEKEIANLKKRIKRAEKAGFIFNEDIIPKDRPKRITKQVLEGIRKIRGEALYSKAQSFEVRNQEHVSPYTISTTLGIESVKQKRKEQNILNLRHRILEQQRQDENNRELAHGIALLNQFDDLSDEEQSRFIRALSDEDFEAFTRAQKWREEVNRVRQADLGTGRETGGPVLQDEGPQYAEDEEDTDEEYYSEPQRPDTPTAEELERKKANEEITDKKVKEWNENYERQKKLKKSERKYIYDGDAIYAGILSRIEQFESDYRAKPERFDKYGNKAACVSFKQMLNNEIRTEGFNNVMRRLDGHGIEIDTALETMLYYSDENKVSAALMQLAEIIKGRVLTQQESAEITARSEAFNYDEADEQLERFQIDELT